MNKDMIERTKDYVMSNGDSRLGKIEIADGEFRFVNYKYFMIELVSGTSFPYSVLTEGMLNLVPTVDLEAPNGVESVIVNEDNEMILIRSGFDSEVSNLQFIAEKEAKDENTKDKYNIINLQSGIYEVLAGMVTIPKEVSTLWQ